MARKILATIAVVIIVVGILAIAYHVWMVSQEIDLPATVMCGI